MNLIIPLILAIVSPFVWGVMNVLDKFVVSHKVKNPLSFTLVAGIANLVLGLVLALFLNWSGVGFKNILFPALAGIIFGAQFFLYYFLMQKEDVSKIIGFVYVYPIIVAFLSFLVLNEKLSLISYVGMIIVLLGAILLSVESRKFKLKVGIWMILLMIFVVALYEFFIKVATSNLPLLNGISVSQISIGVAIMFGFLHKKTRKGFLREIKNIHWSFLAEFLTFIGILTTYFAMAGLPATLVSTLAASQPMAVLLLEKAANKLGLNISKDARLLPKLGPILLIVLGIAIMYSQELVQVLIG